MSFYATAEYEKERLQYFASPEGMDDLYQYNQREQRTVVEVINFVTWFQFHFANCIFDLNWFMMLFILKGVIYVCNMIFEGFDVKAFFTHYELLRSF